jgi:hypothetical protein
MSTRDRNELNYENQERADELRDATEHAHLVAEQQEKPDHRRGHALGYSPEARHSQTATTGHGVASFGHEEIAALAHKLWQARGCPEGSPDQDWFRAVEELRSHAFGH